MSDTPQTTNPFYIYTCTLAIGATLTSGINIGNDTPSIWAIGIPTYTAWCVTATCNIRLSGSHDNVTYRPIGYSNNPSTSSSGFKNWEAAADAGNTYVICEAAQFTPYIKISTTNTATVAVEFIVIGKPVV
jgi:hypothetical protein